MPMKWVEPDVYVLHKEIEVYYTYRGNDYNDPRAYWYSTSVIEDDDFDFDVREIKVPETLDRVRHDLIIKWAIDEKKLDLPDDIAYTH